MKRLTTFGEIDEESGVETRMPELRELVAICTSYGAKVKTVNIPIVLNKNVQNTYPCNNSPAKKNFQCSDVKSAVLDTAHMDLSLSSMPRRFSYFILCFELGTSAADLYPI